MTRAVVLVIATAGLLWWAAQDTRRTASEGRLHARFAFSSPDGGRLEVRRSGGSATIPQIAARGEERVCSAMPAVHAKWRPAAVRHVSLRPDDRVLCVWDRHGNRITLPLGRLRAARLAVRDAARAVSAGREIVVLPLGVLVLGLAGGRLRSRRRRRPNEELGDVEHDDRLDPLTALLMLPTTAHPTDAEDRPPRIP